ncbi:hypothetical protein ONS96_009434 [Cadophora gregata f. sp. sojae]|nr:hypothetical protein ONS96_009434 [Cadophora gregata f. sp. sojae]
MASTSTSPPIAAPSGEPESVGQRQTEDQDGPLRVIVDGSNDIAKNISLDMIVVGITGRPICSKIYVRLGSSKAGKSSKSYDPKLDLATTEIPFIPTSAELEGRPQTKEFLVVGLVLAEDPKKYSTVGSRRPKDKERDQGRKLRGALPAEKNILRALVQTTESIESRGIKYYVACHQMHELCDLRVITVDSIFFLQEIWDEVGEVAQAKDRKTKLGEACRLLAAKDKTPAKRAITSITKDGQTTSNELQVSRKKNAANIINMQFSLWSLTKTPDSYKALQSTVESIMPDLNMKPTDRGVVAFYDFEADMNEKEAQDAVDSMKLSYPHLTMFDKDQVMDLQRALRRTKTGGLLQYQDFARFLDLCRVRALPGMTNDGLDALVTEVLRDLKIINRVDTCRTASEVFHEEKSMIQFISGLKESLEGIASLLEGQATALREQHGGIDTHISITDIMNKVGNVIDQTALKSLMEQVFAIHGEQMAMSNSVGAKALRECIGLLDQALSISG